MAEVTRLDLVGMQAPLLVLQRHQRRSEAQDGGVGNHGCPRVGAGGEVIEKVATTWPKYAVWLITEQMIDVSEQVKPEERK